MLLQLIVVIINFDIVIQRRIVHEFIGCLLEKSCCSAYFLESNFYPKAKSNLSPKILNNISYYHFQKNKFVEMSVMNTFNNK